MEGKNQKEKWVYLFPYTLIFFQPVGTLIICKPHQT